MDSEDIANTHQYRYSAALACDIESKWQRVWAESGTFDTANPVGKLSGSTLKPRDRKFYVLDMFPYPSGSGLHVGHPLGYIGSDVCARFMRMKGYVLPLDTVDLPSDLQLMVRPATGRARPIVDLVGEFEAGIREPVSLANPDGLPWRDLDKTTRRRVVDSYRLAYLQDAPVNWCPGLGTVLANEEVTTNARSDIGNYPVYRRRMRQWMLRITAFADRLLEDLDPLNWSDSLKLMQRNWIGRSEGADVYFTARTSDGSQRRLQVYTTRPDTLFGVTFFVLAPEHPMVDELAVDEWPLGTPVAWRGPSASGGPPDSPREAVAAYVERASSLSDRQRQEQVTKTAVFTGSYAVNPVSGEQVPIFVADYILAGYGSGAVMAVPAHDQRDYELATALDLPMRAVVSPDDGWLAEHGSATTDDPVSWGEAFERTGTAINSTGADVSLTGLSTADAAPEILRWLQSAGRGVRRTSYRLRDWLFSRQRYWGEPFPIVYDEMGLPVALPESMLPVELPPMTDFRPQPIEGDEPKPPLSRAAGFEYVELDLGDGTRAYRRETNTMPQWAGSCWYYLRYLDPTNEEQFVDPEIERYWMGSGDGAERIGGADLYIGGVEHAVLHLLYARFWHKILFDLGHVSTPEPFQRLYNQGYILADAFTNTTSRLTTSHSRPRTPPLWSRPTSCCRSRSTGGHVARLPLTGRRARPR